MSLAISLFSPTPRTPAVNTGPQRAAPAFRAWLHRLERLYGDVALLDLHR